MANLRDIRTRISSVNNTQQITKAMKMVAAAKLRKAQNKMSSNRPFAKKMKDVVVRLQSGSTTENELLRKPESVDRVLFLVVGSDKGLCGGFNNNLFKVVETTIFENYQQYVDDKALDVITIGKKAGAYFKKRNYSVVGTHPGFFDDLSYSNTSEIMEFVIAEFTNGTYDRVVLAFNEFRTVIAQNRIVEQLLPIEPETIAQNEGEISEVSTTDYIYEPDTESILNELLPVYLVTQLWKAVLESNASEQGARMAAMDNATENAKELEQELRLKYNQARQSAITTEISEIVSGAQALEDN
ncbi:MAG: ATP synthase F1 subunit gamma [Balneolaceae bacterium]